MRIPLRTAAPAALAAAAVALAGCGEGSDQVSADELIRRGDGICAEDRRAFARIQSRAPANAAAAAAQAERLLEVATDSLDELRGIPPPDELRERYDAYLEARARAVELLERGREAAAGRDAAAYRGAQAKAAAERRERLRLARAVGFRVCSKP